LLDTSALLTSPIPLFGDAVGLLADTNAIRNDPSNPVNYGMAGLGLLTAGPSLPLLARVAKGPNAFKRVKKTGAFVGAPPGIRSEADVQRLAEQYAARVERALDGGLDPDYFYRQGEQVIKDISPDATTARQFAETNAITSSEAPVSSNVGWAVQPFEQRAAGYPVRTGKYPVEASAKIEDVLNFRDPHLGEKRHLYGQGLSGIGREMPPELRRAPNDRWEIRSMGYTKDSAGPAQHKFMHGVREMAMDIVNKRRGTDLDVYNIQELNWAQYRADELGLSVADSASDNVQNAVKGLTFQHSWETVPGKQSGLLGQVDLGAHDAALQDIYFQGGNRDALIDAYGGTFQPAPLKNVPGVFEGNVTPYGHQSRSLVYHSDRIASVKNKIKDAKKAGATDEVARLESELAGLQDNTMARLAQGSQDRVRATENTRSYFNLQDAGAGSLLNPSKRKTVAEFGGALSFDLGRTITGDEAQQVVDTLKKYYGVDDFGVVPTESGVHILATGAKGLEKQVPELTGLLGKSPMGTDFSKSGFYNALPWKERKATESLLDSFTPTMRERADSDEVRAMAGRLYDYYKGLDAETPTGYLDVLKTWATSGIDGVQNLVKQGLAPAAVLGIVIGPQLMREGTSQSRPSA
jgi:hypothetical protein